MLYADPEPSEAVPPGIQPGPTNPPAGAEIDVTAEDNNSPVQPGAESDLHLPDQST
jgi:hypothetical protein